MTLAPETGLSGLALPLSVRPGLVDSFWVIEDGNGARLAVLGPEPGSERWAQAMVLVCNERPDLLRLLRAALGALDTYHQQHGWMDSDRVREQIRLALMKGA